MIHLLSVREVLIIFLNLAANLIHRKCCSCCSCQNWVTFPNLVGLNTIVLSEWKHHCDLVNKSIIIFTDTYSFLQLLQRTRKWTWIDHYKYVILPTLEYISTNESLNTKNKPIARSLFPDVARASSWACKKINYSDWFIFTYLKQ